ncbi:MAG: site-specific integrase [Defluviitaleaceae bacterium]|nr:site-specific integrase [Defluviitaleaceae bacterium]
MTVERWANTWLETYKKPVVGDSQYRDYRFYINSAILPEIDCTRLGQIKDVHLQKILNMHVGKSKSYLTKLRITISAMFKRAYLSKLIPHNPAENLELPAATEGTHRRVTDYERSKILSLSEVHHAGLWVKLMLYTGLRPGETRALDWRHIDFDKSVVQVEQAMKAYTTNIGGPKSKAGVRSVPINKDLLRDLLVARKCPFEPVFTKPVSGKRHNEKSMLGMWNNFKRHLDIDIGAKLYLNKIILSVVASDLVPYCLRHTYCTDLQDAGIPINVARYLMGHSSITMTAKIYTHTTEATIQEAAKKINDSGVYKKGNGGKNGGTTEIFTSHKDVNSL